MRGNNFHHAVEVGVALVPQSINGATATGATISKPWEKGRQLSLFLLGGAFGASSSGRCRVQQQKKSDDSWVAVTESDGTTQLEFTVTALDDAGSAENGALLGTIPLKQIDGTTYKALRVTYEEEGSAAQLVAVGYIISDFYDHPSGQADDLFSKIVPSPAA